MIESRLAEELVRLDKLLDLFRYKFMTGLSRAVLSMIFDLSATNS